MRVASTICSGEGELAGRERERALTNEGKGGRRVSIDRGYVGRFGEVIAGSRDKNS